jgi:hypothetical protein
MQLSSQNEPSFLIASYRRRYVSVSFLESRMIEGSPNPKQWLWATADGSKLNGDRFIIVQGKRDLYYRTRQELRGDEHGPWNQIGPDDGHATLADCFTAEALLLPAYFTIARRLQAAAGCPKT